MRWCRRQSGTPHRPGNGKKAEQHGAHCQQRPYRGPYGMSPPRAHGARRALGPTDSVTVAWAAGIEQRSRARSGDRNRGRGRHSLSSGFFFFRKKNKRKKGRNFNALSCSALQPPLQEWQGLLAASVFGGARCSAVVLAVVVAAAAAAPASRFNARHAPDLLPLAPSRGPPARSPWLLRRAMEWNPRACRVQCAHFFFLSFEFCIVL